MSKSRKKYGPPSAAEQVSGYLVRLGVSVDPLRLEEKLAAQRDREAIENREHIANVRSLVSSVRRARREVELCEGLWRMNPSQFNLQEAMQAQRAHNAAEEHLLAAVDYDKALFRAALR
jgi:hypothetical protein